MMQWLLFWIRMFILYVIAFSLLTIVKCAGALMCDNDSDCQDGFSCIENTCKICVKCSLIFRKSNNCASDFNDCGDCLEGYKAISVTDNTEVKKPCRPINKKMNLKECATDNHCPPDNYCSENSCVNCFDCSLINKITPEKCARDPNECGPCFIGYLSIHDRSRPNYNKCEKVSPDPVPYTIHSVSVQLAFIMAIAVAVVVIIIQKKYTGCVSLKTVRQSNEASAPPEYLIESWGTVAGGQFGGAVKVYIENECKSGISSERCTTQEVQQAKVFKYPCASYYPKEGETSEEISEPDSGQNETSNAPDQPASAQREETNLSHFHVGYAGRILPEVNSVNSHSDFQNEQPDDVNGLNNDSAENNSHLFTEDPAQVPENQAKEPTEDLSLGK